MVTSQRPQPLRGHRRLCEVGLAGELASQPDVPSNAETSPTVSPSTSASPQDWAAGRDPQLERAVDPALEALAARPVVTPPDPATHPSRARPPLLARP